MAGGEAELGAAFFPGPVKHGVPELATDALAADGNIGDKIFEIGDFANDGAHNDGKSGDADDFVLIVDGEKHVVSVGFDKIVKPFFGYFAAIFAAA